MVTPLWPCQRPKGGDGLHQRQADRVQEGHPQPSCLLLAEGGQIRRRTVRDRPSVEPPGSCALTSLTVERMALGGLTPQQRLAQLQA